MAAPMSGNSDPLKALFAVSLIPSAIIVYHLCISPLNAEIYGIGGHSIGERGDTIENNIAHHLNPGGVHHVA